MPSVETVHGVFAATFPAKAELASVEYVETVPTDGGFSIVVRLIIWESGPSGPTIRDIKEQQIWLGMLAETSAERLTEYAKALVTVLGQVLVNIAVLETLMPHDLVITNVLKLKNAQTEDQFGRALRVKSRLGRYLS